MFRSVVLGVLFALAFVHAPGAHAQSSPAASSAELDADRTKSNALTPAQRKQAEDLFREAFEQSRAGQFEAARLLFESGLAIDPANVLANFFIAQTLQQLRDTAQARRFFNRVIAFDPNSPQAAQSADALKALSASTAPADAMRTAAPIAAAQERLLRPKDVFKECEQCPEMVVVPAGSFLMGAADSDDPGYGNNANEKPQHKVTFAQPFAVGKFSVTFAEWDACVADGGCDGYRPIDKGWGRGRQPVIYVSWNDAKSYLAWLARKTGKPYRLLSEAEREYVTRAGTTTAFWWGAQISTSLANYNGRYAYLDGPKGDDRQRTLPVDSFSPNPWGLYQVHGNVAEWTEDCWSKDYIGAPANGAARTDGDCSAHFVRGGSWDGLPDYLRAATRQNEYAKTRHYALGFRVARSLAR